MKLELNILKYDRDKFNSIIDTEFKELKTKEENKIFDINQATLDDFFILYEKFFYDIPKLGENQSHEYIINQSNNYINLELINDTIIALTEEINQLREENLKLITDNSTQEKSQEKIQ